MVTVSSTIMEETLAQLEKQLEELETLLSLAGVNEELISIKMQLIEGINGLKASMSQNIVENPSISVKVEVPSFVKKGKLCMAPRLFDRSLDLAIIVSFEPEVDEALVVWVRPRNVREIKCDFFLNGSCKFSNTLMNNNPSSSTASSLSSRRCSSSHGVTVPLSSLQPPMSFTSSNELSHNDQVWAPYNRIWYRGSVIKLNSTTPTINSNVLDSSSNILAINNNSGLSSDMVKIKWLNHEGIETVMVHDITKVREGERCLVIEEDKLNKETNAGSSLTTINKKRKNDGSIDYSSAQTLESLINEETNELLNDKSIYRILDTNIHPIERPTNGTNHNNNSITDSSNDTMDGYIQGDWERHTRCIASKLMAKMGYIRGTPLGNHETNSNKSTSSSTSNFNLIRPISIEIFPKGVGVDYCRNPQDAIEKARKVAATLRRKNRKLKAQEEAEEKERIRKLKSGEVDKKDLFGIINGLDNNT